MKKSDTITISSWFQRAPTSAWEEPVFIPRGKSPVTSNSSLTLAFTTVIKSKILSSKRSSSLLTAVVLLTDAENFHILGLSSFIILRISCYWIITSVWAGASSVLAGTPQQSGSGAQEDPPSYLPWLLSQWATAGCHTKLLGSCPGRVNHTTLQVLGVSIGFPFATPPPGRRNPETQISSCTIGSFQYPNTSNNSFFLPIFVKFSNWVLQYLCDLSQACTFINEVWTGIPNR